MNDRKVLLVNQYGVTNGWDNWYRRFGFEPVGARGFQSLVVSVAEFQEVCHVVFLVYE